MKDAFIALSSLVFFWIGIESSFFLTIGKDRRYGWLGLAFFALSLFGIYALIVGK